MERFLKEARDTGDYSLVNLTSEYGIDLKVIREAVIKKDNKFLEALPIEYKPVVNYIKALIN